MKTKQFIKEIWKLGYHLDCSADNRILFVNYFKIEKARISKLELGYMLINSDDLGLIKLCLEYAETPIKDREEEKKYIVILPDPEQNSLHVRALCKAGINRVIIGFDNELIVKKQGSFRLTEAEIKRNHEYLWQLAKEVEDNE